MDSPEVFCVKNGKSVLNFTIMYVKIIINIEK